jgi:hypothetical protein
MGIAVISPIVERFHQLGRCIAQVQWGEVFVESAMTLAAVDRLVRQYLPKGTNLNNPQRPVFAEFRGLVLKPIGLADAIRATLVPLAAQIELAFVYGSVARQQDTTQSDVDLMIVSPM